MIGGWAVLLRWLPSFSCIHEPVFEILVPIGQDEQDFLA